MSAKKGMPRYSAETKNKIILEQASGVSIKALSKRYGISRYAIEQVIKRLEMDNELLRNFLSAALRSEVSFN